MQLLTFRNNMLICRDENSQVIPVNDDKSLYIEDGMGHNNINEIHN